MTRSTPSGDESSTVALPVAAGGRPRAIRIGRREDCDIVVDDPLVSRVHATVVSNGTLEIIDNASINGTFINGRRVARAALGEGDVVTVGNTDLTVVEGALVARSAGPGIGGLEAQRLGLSLDEAGPPI